MKARHLCISALVLAAAKAVPAQTPLGTAFTYQGQLKQSGSPANGSLNMVFKLFDAATLGVQVGPTLTFDSIGGNPPPISVTNGLFTVQLDFGAIYNGDKLWLEIVVSGITLSPRQELTAAPYSLHARDAWALGGNSGTNPPTNFLGTTDATPLELRVEGLRAFGLSRQSLIDSGFPYTGVSVKGGTEINEISVGVPGATIAGGGLIIGGAFQKNRVTDLGGTVGGGAGNIAGNDSGTAGDAQFATVGGGQDNTASGYTSIVAGGNTSIASGFSSTVGGGSSNSASGFFSTVGGGSSNIASSDYSTVAGGSDNTASGFASAVPGGLLSSAAGAYSLAAGNRAKANHNGSFVWSDSLGADFASTGIDQFIVRASGGVGIGTNSPGNQLSVFGNADFSGSVGIGTSTPGVPLEIYTPCPLGCYGLIHSDGTRQVGSYVNPEGGWLGTLSNDPLHFFTNNSGILMTLTTGGALGIGTSSPTAWLDISPGGGVANIHLFASELTDNFDGVLRIRSGGNVVSFDGSDNVGIGTAGPSQRLHVIGNICATGTIGACSDARFKKNVMELTGALDRVGQLRGVSFEWKCDEFADQRFADGRQVGFIAQEVEKVLPQVVAKGSDGYLSVNYGRLTPLLVEAMKELKTENARLRAQLDDLKRAISEIQRNAPKEGVTP